MQKIINLQSIILLAAGVFAVFVMLYAVMPMVADYADENSFFSALFAEACCGDGPGGGPGGDGPNEGTPFVPSCPAGQVFDPQAGEGGLCVTPQVFGCTNPAASNFNANANINDGSCQFDVPGCTDPTANNFNANATVDNNSCTFDVPGCTDPTAANFNANATIDDNSCVFATAPAISIIKRDATDQDDTQAVAVTGTANFEIIVTNTGSEDLVNVVVTDPLEASCDRTIGSLAIGASDTYTCSTTNVTAAFTNVANVTGDSAVDGATVTDTDPTEVTIATDPAIQIIKRDSADQDDTQTVATGGTANFEIIVTNTGSEDLVNVVVTDPIEPSCAHTVGNLAVGASSTAFPCSTTNVTAAFTNTAFVTGDSAVDGTTVSDDDPTEVLILSQNVFSCAANLDSFVASPNNLPVGGGTTVLTWETTGVASLSINNGIVSTDVDNTVGESINITNDTTFTMTINDGAGNTDSCPITVSVDNGGGGGGGGSSSPRCEIEVSDRSVSAGDTVTLTWDTTRTNDITIIDDEGNVVISTEDMNSDDRRDNLDGEIDVVVTKDTEFTLSAERGSRERECRVNVETENAVIVLSERTQDPVVAGISLTQLPHTGFEAGPALTALFYTILAAWGVFVAYLLVIKKETVLGFSLPVPADLQPAAMKEEVVEAPVETVVAATAVAEAPAPANLPIATPEAQVGYATAAVPVDEKDASMLELENHAHERRALLSSDAMRYFTEYSRDSFERLALLERVITEAKVSYPTEDGWVVINRERMVEVCNCDNVKLAVAAEAAPAPVITEAAPATEPVGASSLAESIVTGNITAAYLMLGENPMFALTDAITDLDNVYRARKGEHVVVSDMLESAAADITDEKIVAAISAITSAIDGTYSDEAAAVKLAIMKAIKAVA